MTAGMPVADLVQTKGLGLGLTVLDAACARRFAFDSRARDAATDLFFRRVGEEALASGFRRCRARLSQETEFGCNAAVDPAFGRARNGLSRSMARHVVP